MEQQFSWDNHLLNPSSGHNNSIIFSSENQSDHTEPSSFVWIQDDNSTWSAGDGCPHKRMKLEDRLQDISERTSDSNFQSFYLSSCFQNTADLNKDSCGFSYFPQPHMRE